MSSARPWLRSLRTRARDLAVAAGQHAALPRHELLVRVEAERGRVAARSDPGAGGVDGAERLARVLDDAQAPFPGELLERLHVGGIPEQVHRQQPGRRWARMPQPAASGSMFSVRSSMSQKTGTACSYSRQFADATKLSGVVTTSSPALQPSARTAR